MAKTLLVAGTASHVGKSTIAAGLCRYLADRGSSVVPFKAQNMSNNARVAITPDGEWGEIGVSQYVQARAAGVPATTDMNPVLLKPRGDRKSQLILDGQAVADVSATDYYDELWDRARDAAIAAHERLSAAHEVVIAEGAGSISEINLHDRDLANIETAAFADAAILLVTDIDRGGAFASVVGTVELLPGSVRDRVVGIAITKFRGDRSLLDAGIETIETRTGIPVLGVLPYSDPGLPAEDSVSLPATGDSTTWGADDAVPASESVTVAVPKLPRISNFTDLEPLASEPGVRVVFQPLDAGLDAADAVVLPGTKNTVDDLIALNNAGFDEALRAFSGPIVGLCGGYQMLGERITNAAIEGTGDQESLQGFGLLPVETRFSSEKHVERVTRSIRGVGPLEGASGTVEGYEIHMGDVTVTGEVERPFTNAGAVQGRVLGTFLHGLFENPNARSAFVENLFSHSDQARPASSIDADSAYNAAAALIEDHLSLEPLGLTEPIRASDRG